jgi:hypothetical protein
MCLCSTSERIVELHLDGVVEVAGEIPAGGVSRMGKESARAGDVFLRAQRIDFIFNSVVLAGNGDDARAMHGTGGGAQRGETEAQVVPGKIEGVGERHNGEGSEEGATEQIHRWGTSGHVWVGHGRSLQAKGTKWDTDESAWCVVRKPRRNAQAARIGAVVRNGICCTD